MTNPTSDDVAETLAEYERLAISTGARVAFDAPEFSGDGDTWSQVWLAETPPAAARVTVYRDGAATTVVRLWRDSLPTEESWRALWLERPMVLFGAFVRRDAIRRAFRDQIGDRREPDEIAPAPARPERDWGAELAATKTVAEVDALARAARDVPRVMTPAFESEFRRRRAGIAEPAQHRQSRGIVVPLSREVAEEIGAVSAPRPTPRPPAPGVHTLAEVVKPRNSRKGESRAQRDSGRRRGGGQS